ncbi:MAG TPA: chromosomal replication initiator protein DnaA [Mogibacterium sp.]|nr:chromosomal replication initiator protein DnaA [Mogibacterium sp.]
MFITIRRDNLNKNKIWGTTLNFLKANTTDLTYNTWIAPLYIHKIEEEAGIIYLAWNNQPNLIEHINQHYLQQIENAINNSLDKKYRVIIKHEKEYEVSKIDTTTKKKSLNQEKLFNPRFNFENFIVGNSNKYAHAVSVAVAENPGNIYNPLFIYGGSGLGKTHLMQAIGVHIIRNNPSAKVLYVSSEMFTNEMISAINDNKTRLFRNKYRKLDVLLIDDIQFLEGKDATQEEFFHTFEALYQNNKQIVITSDCPPVSLKGLDERLRTRFSWNMIADIQPPDYETRVAILKNLVKKSNIEMTESLYQVICFIAEQVKDNIRELEGAYNRVIGLSQLLREDITIASAKNILKDIIRDNNQAIAPERIRTIVAQHFKVKLADIDSPKRNAEITLPRQIAMYLCRLTTDLSLNNIGKLFGNRHYSTVIHAVEKITKDLNNDEELKTHLEIINSKLQAKKK